MSSVSSDDTLSSSPLESPENGNSLSNGGSSSDDSSFKNPQIYLKDIVRKVKSNDQKADTAEGKRTNKCNAQKTDIPVENEKEPDKEGTVAPPGKRKYHKETEKKRREKINKLIDDLTGLVPMCRNSPYKLDKLTVLKMTVFHLKMLKQKRAAEGIFSPFKPLGVKEDEMRVLLEQAGNGFLFVIASERAQVLYISDVVSDVIGYTPGSMIGRSLYTMIHNRDVNVIKEQIKPFGSLPSVNTARAARLKNGGRLEPEVGCMSGSRRSFYCRFRAVERTTEVDTSTEFRLIDKVDSKASDMQYEDGHFFITVFCTGFLKTWQVADRPLYEVPDDIELSTSTCFIGIGRSVQTMPPSQLAKVPPKSVVWPTNFTSRHSADAKFLYVDSSVVPICGFLPQDLVGQSEYDYIHHDDVSVLADTFRKVVQLKEQEKVVSKVYRAKVKGGGVIQMRTVAFSLFNPFSEELEYIVHKNYVVWENSSKTSQQKELVPLDVDRRQMGVETDKQQQSVLQVDGEVATLDTPEKTSDPDGRKDSSIWSPPCPVVVNGEEKTSVLVAPVTAQLVLSRANHVVDADSGRVYASSTPFTNEIGQQAHPPLHQVLKQRPSSFTEVRDTSPEKMNVHMPDIIIPKPTISKPIHGSLTTALNNLLANEMGERPQATHCEKRLQDPLLSKEAEENVRILATTALALHENSALRENVPLVKELDNSVKERVRHHTVMNRCRKVPNHSKHKHETLLKPIYAAVADHGQESTSKLHKNGQEVVNDPQSGGKQGQVCSDILSFIQDSVGKAVRESLPSLLELWSKDGCLAQDRKLDNDGPLRQAVSERIANSLKYRPGNGLDLNVTKSGKASAAQSKTGPGKCEQAQILRKTSVISCVGKCSSSEGSSTSSETSDPGSSEEEESLLRDFQTCAAENALVDVLDNGSEMEKNVMDPFPYNRQTLTPFYAAEQPRRFVEILENGVSDGQHDCSSESTSSSPDIRAYVNSRKRKRIERDKVSNSSDKSSPCSLLNDSGNESEASGESLKRQCYMQQVNNSGSVFPSINAQAAIGSSGSVRLNHDTLPYLLNSVHGANGNGLVGLDPMKKSRTKTYAQMVGSVENVLRDHLLGGVTYAGRQCDTGHLAARILSILGLNGSTWNLGS